MALRRGLRDWLLAKDADPSVRLRVLQDLLDRPDDDPAVIRTRREIGREGWAARILKEQRPDGQWLSQGTSARELYTPKYLSANWKLLVLSDLGLTRKHPRVAKGMDLLIRRYREAGEIGRPRSELCILANTLRMMLRLGYAKHPQTQVAIDWLVQHQKKDGGWHCFRSSTGTLDGWEGLAAFAALPPDRRSGSVQRSIERGAEFYLRRGLLREGRTAYAPWRRLHYPNHYFYDVLVGLNFLTALGYGDDPRIRPALNLLERKRNRDGSWNLDAHHPDSEDPGYRPRGPFYPFGLEIPGQPSRWITTTALTVLKRVGR